MDLMRTLLIYMSTTLMLAVQSTSAPQATPTPTPVPAVTVSAEGTTQAPAETPAPGETAEETAAAGAKFTPAPVPTITPNAKGYHNLSMGSRGKEVRRLQEKLIELKYLPEGSADGAYGRKTYNAVKKFQYYNGLKADGVAGRATQTNLFENPAVVPNPEAESSPTEAPAESPKVTEAPTEAPTGTPEVTKAPTEAPTGTPEVTEAPTEAPTKTPEMTEAPTEAPTKTPEMTEAPTEAPTEPPEVTEAPTEAPEPSAVPDGTPEVSEAPESTEVPADYVEVIENVDLDAEEYEPVKGQVALNEGDGPLEFVKTEDGVPVTARPRLSRSGNRIRVSLDDLCACVESWRLTDEGVGSVVLEAAGYTLVLYNEDQGCSATLDGMEIPMKPEDFDFSGDGHFISATFLASALNGEAEWDEEEKTLMLRIRDKEEAEVRD